ncbi:hypothetical protein ANI_1_6124 [Paecilomyces variotii No. 5]|uniref:RRM domain-containing protein n=1 Tax=Byssochlamys spectabilis (strain No. 5 / NBRC 109023) TaxID=1356009 RepID=V5FS73_BYSSN|nr:hypothetical protein ANI_1_6124 [Paecilomyces variotii No. 5]
MAVTTDTEDGVTVDPHRVTEDAPGVTIVVEKLTKNVTEDHLREIFGTFGEIQSLELPMNKAFMTNRGTAYILYYEVADAEAAISHMHEAQLDGAVLNPLWRVAEQAVSVPLRLDADRLLGVDTLGQGQWTDMIVTVHGLYHDRDLVPLGAAALTHRHHTQGLLHPGETHYEETAPSAADAAVPVTAVTVATVAGAEARAGTEAAVDTALGEDKWISRRSRAIGLIIGGICFVSHCSFSAG